MTTGPSAAPPGWYPDPWRVAALRWWGGSAWTGYTAAAPIAGRGLRLDDEVVAARRARWAMAATAVLQVLAIGLLLAAVTRMAAVVRLLVESPAQSFPDEEVAWFMAAGFLSSALSFPAFLALALLLVWVYRVVANGAALGHRGPRDATIAVVSFFIPVVSLWWPYQSLRDAVPESATEARQALLRWWVVWVLSPFVSLPAFVLAIFSVAGAVAAVVLWAGVLIVAVALGWRAIGLLTACHIEEGRRDYRRSASSQ